MSIGACGAPTLVSWSNLTITLITPLLQRALFLSDESLFCPFQHCLDLVKIHLEASDT